MDIDMKTQQILSLTFAATEVTINHATAYGDLTQVLEAANLYRVADADGKNIQLASLLASDGFQRQCKLLTEDTDFALDKRGAFYKEGAGRNTRTKAHILLLLYVAQVVSPRFHYEFNKRVIIDGLLRWRDVSGDEFIVLNSALVNNQHPVLGKDAHRGHFVQLAKIIKERVNPTGGGWNTATASELRSRAEIEQSLVKVLNLGLVRDWDHLKALAAAV